MTRFQPTTYNYSVSRVASRHAYDCSQVFRQSHIICYGVVMAFYLPKKIPENFFFMEHPMTSASGGVLHWQNKGVALKCSLYSDLRPRSRCTVKLKSALTFDFCLKSCLTLVQSLVNFCKITFTQLSLKVLIVVYTKNSMLDFWPAKKSVNLTLTFDFRLDWGRRLEYRIYWSATPLQNLSTKFRNLEIYSPNF